MMHFDGNILAITGKSTKISPLQNFMLYTSGQVLHNSKSMYKIDLHYMYDVKLLPKIILIITIYSAGTFKVSVKCYVVINHIASYWSPLRDYMG